jgi:hypothetical protein
MHGLRIKPITGSFPAAAIRAGAWAFFWRQSRGDGLYGVPGNLLVPASGAHSKYEGSLPIAQVDWQATPQISVHLNAACYFTGPFGKQAENAPASLSYLSFWATYRF